uniref:Uncharacterized protein n=2 Tax=Rubinisphaera brasiliensis TaxID=119 RepID=F0SNF9_RUBBR|nr:hypothetical protein Plabr_0163 [Rubinisphaera brasiliensis DSM 5305]
MKLIAVCRKKRKPYPGDICHQVRRFQFDGLARRGDYERHMAPPVAYWSEDRTPLTCSRHGRFVPDIFMPHISWVISEKVKAALPDSVPSDFLPVNFEKLVDFPLIGEEVEHWDPPAFVDFPPDLINNYPDVSAFHQKVGPYYEWLAPLPRTLTEEFQDINHIDILIDEMNHEEDIPISHKMIETYPAMTTGRFTLFAPAVFEIISPFLDWDYFVKTELEI